MAAAWDLTCKDNKDACDVTIFQMGGRLGGKGASSRNPDHGDRIEEHGLHLWLGYYENAFRMVRTCYLDLKATAAGDIADPELQPLVQSRPFDTWNWRAAFQRASLVALADDSSGDWMPWVARFPEYVPRSENGVTGTYELDDGTPIPGVHVVDDRRRAYPGEEPIKMTGRACENGEDVCLQKVDVAFFLTHAMRELQAFVESLEARVEQLSVQKPLAPLTEDPDELLSDVLNAAPSPFDGTGSADALQVLRLVRLTILAPAIQAFATIASVAEGPIPFVRNGFVALLDRYIDAMRERIEIIVQGDTAARRLWELIDLLAANIRGLVVAGLQGQDDFSALDEWNYDDWLRMNRIAERTLRNPIVRGAHDLGFAYADGNAHAPRIAAGQALNAACRFFFMYKGALFWRMTAGMGDVLFAPMYLALRARGVKFRFFHRLDDIELARDHQTVTRLKFRRQVPLKVSDRDAPTNYQPLVLVPGKRPMPGWRVKPDACQFDQATQDAPAGHDEEAGIDFESTWFDGPHGGDVFATVGAAKAQPANPSWIGHFDAVIVTVPVAGLGRVSDQLATAPNDAGRRWSAMLRNISTVATQAVQLWVNKPTHELGWTYGQVSLSGFVHPFDTWADLSQLLEVENQPHAQGVHYLCSVLPEQQLPPALRECALRLDARHRPSPRDLVTARQLVRANARRFLDEWMFHLWPDRNAAYRYPNAFQWNVLVDAARASGPRRLDSQHLVANVDPSERFTQSLPGTTKYRIRPGDTGFRHLFIAGDWTDCGLNFGCVEAAVISGRLASSAITRFPDVRLIPGFSESVRRVMATEGGI